MRINFPLYDTCKLLCWLLLTMVRFNACANEGKSVFVNGRSRPVIMEDMQRRIDRGDLAQERKDAIEVSHLSD